MKVQTATQTTTINTPDSCAGRTCSHCLRTVSERYEHLNLSPAGDAWLWSCVAR